MANEVRVNRALRRLGFADLTTDRVEKFLSLDSEAAAELVRLALERFLDQIRADSRSGIFNGY